MNAATAICAEIMRNQNDYCPGDTFYVLLKPEDIPYVVEDWLYYDYLQGDMLLHRSIQNEGMLVLETKSTMFAYKAFREHHGVKISIRKMDGTMVNG